MIWLNAVAEKWWPLFALHMVEIALFILLLATVERIFKLNVTTRYALWLLGLAKVFIPPFIALPALLTERVPVTLLPNLITANVAVARAPSAVSPYSLLFALWVISAVLFFGLMVKRHLQLRQSLRTAKSITPFANMVCPTFETNALTSPVLFGLLRPRLYLPQDWRSWSPQQLQSILQHEAAHLHGRDLWALSLEYAALALFGLNPLVWLMRRRLTFLRELRCDLAAISQAGLSALAYGKLLYAFAEKQTRPAAALATGITFAAQQSTLYQRLQHLLTRKESEMTTNKFLRYPLLGAMSVAMLVLSWQCSERPAQADKTSVALEGESYMAKASQGFDQPPNVTFFQSPKYPEQMRQAGLEAEVLLQLTIDIEGNVMKATPAQVTITKNGAPISPGSEAFQQESGAAASKLFSDAAAEAAQGFKFKPALLKSKAVRAEVVIPFKFKLDVTAGALVPHVNVDLC